MIIIISNSDNKAELKSTAAGIVIVVCGLGGVFFRAFLLGALVNDVGLPEFLASNVVAASASGILLGNFLMLLKVHIWNRKKIAYMAIGCMLCSNTAGLFLHEYEQLITIFIVSGTGEGVLIALGSAVIAGSTNVTKFVGLQTVIGSCVAAGTAFLAPYLIQWQGVNGIFLFLLIYPFITLLSVFWLKSFASVTAHSIDGKPSSINRKNSAITLLATLIVFTGIGAFWPFLETIVMQFDVSRSVFGVAVSIGMFIGGLMALMAIILSDRFGFLYPVLLGSLLMVIAASVTNITLNNLIILLLVPLYLLGSATLVVYHNAYLASLDAQGRVFVFGIVMESLGAILGPLLAGAILRFGGGYDMLSWFFIVSVVVYCLLRWLCLLSFERRERVVLLNEVH